MVRSHPVRLTKLSVFFILSFATFGLGQRVDLGYAIYEGYTNLTTNLSIWKGIRYAAPPIGNLRFNKPQPPQINRTEVTDARDWAPQCHQNPNSNDDGSSTQTRSDEYGPSDEDCLFLNVWAPAGRTNLPVLVWIHGGGYGYGNASSDLLSAPVIANNNSFIVLAIQYRLGAFGFLSSDEVYRNGAVNAGLYDILFALQWVQQYIDRFGGDQSQVTINGVSSGAGAVMLASLAFGGTLESTLFSQAIASSPYLPTQYGYKDWVPSQSYYAFANMAGCAPTTAYGTVGPTILDCLRSKDTETLMRASQNVSASGLFGSWAFLPVTDGELIQALPSQQLMLRKVNGRRMLAGNTANDGPTFVPYSIQTEEDLVNWLTVSFPLFSTDDIAKLLLYYPSPDMSVDMEDPLFATNGITGPTAINQSSFATGHQQRAFNIYAENSFVCPSYWLAEAYGENGRESWKYQYSVPLAVHAADVYAYFGPPDETQGPDLINAFEKIIGNFVTAGNPFIGPSIANGNSTSNNSAEAASSWPTFSVTKPFMLNINQTGGTEEIVAVSPVANSTVHVGPGLQNDFSLVNAYTWEGGRGFRCDFWRSMGYKVPG